MLVLVVIALLSLAGFTFSELMFAEHKAALVAAKRIQARSAAESGLEMAKLFLTMDSETQETYGGTYDNPEQFRGIALRDETTAEDASSFTFIAPRWDKFDDSRGGIRYGLEDESTRLNLNVLVKIDESSPGTGQAILMALPGMTEEIADAILDWIDEDDDPREFGAESEYYTSLTPSYSPKNGPLDTIEELLLVRDVSGALLFGSDGNRNALSDGDEPEMMVVEDVDNSDGSMSRGWSAYLTLYSLEQNVNPDGEPKIDLNQDDLEALYDELAAVMSEDWATFIVAYRQQEEPYSGTDTGDPLAGQQIDFNREGTTKLDTILDLVGASVRVQFDGGSEPEVIAPMFPDMPGTADTYLSVLMDYTVAASAEAIPGRINVNQASRTVLLGIPGITSDTVDSILSNREEDPLMADTSQRHETWLYSSGLVTLDEMKSLMPFVTGGGCIHRAHVVGFFEAGGPTVRIEALLDASESPPRVLFYRDLTHLGRGYSLDTLSSSMSME